MFAAPTRQIMLCGSHALIDAARGCKFTLAFGENTLPPY
jgi:hypothetical protein